MDCNLCASDNAELIARENAFRIVRCGRCGLVYVNPRPRPDELATLYADYHARDGGNEESWSRLMRRIFREAADLLGAREGSGCARLLDVGCGFGNFVDLMRTRGWDAEGIDPSPRVVEAAARKGRRVRLGMLEELPTDHVRYDVVTMFYVLEHLSDPMGGLRKAFDLLVPGGTLLIRVPHTTPIVRLLAPVGLGAGLYDPPFHLYDFSPVVLREMLDRTGFEGVRTFPGKPTVPAGLGPRLAASFFGTCARWLHAGTRGTVLLPGVSTTTIARKPSA